MRSESLARLDVRVSDAAANPKAGASAEIEAQTKAFLAGGGVIQELPTNQAANVIFSFSPGDAAIAAEREEVGGVVLISRQLVGNLLGCTANTVSKWMNTRGVPRPRKKGKPVRWVESEILAWVEKHGGDQ